MTPVEWEIEQARVTDMLGALCTAVIDDTYTLARLHYANGTDRTGIMVDGKVLFVVMDAHEQTPARPAGGTLQ